jgi:hypothetical protein
MKPTARRTAIFVTFLVALGAAVFLAGARTRAAADAVPAPSAAALAPPHAPPPPMQVDTPPRLIQASGWPFQQLPLVTKFAIPQPRPGLVAINPPPFHRVLLPPRPLAGPPVAPVGPPSVWWAAPVAAGAFVGGSDATVGDAVVPEPSTWILMSMGLLLIGIQTRRRRRRSPPH